MTYRIRAQWADAIRYGQWEEADRLWKLMMAEWLAPKVADQEHWNNVLNRRMAALERKDRHTDDQEWDNAHGDLNQ